VRVPVLGGASAGGMCAAMAAIFLDARFPPVRPETLEAERRRNPLYRAWVPTSTSVPLLGNEDVRSGRPLESLLDCTVLDRIVDGLLDERPRLETARRPWLASPLRTVLTLSNLRGVPYALAFEGSGFRHWMSHHADHVRYAIELDAGAEAAPEEPAKIGETPLDRRAPRGSDARECFKAVALGTGGFPVALAPRVLKRPASDYLYPRRADAQRAAQGRRGRAAEARLGGRHRPGLAAGAARRVRGALRGRRGDEQRAAGPGAARAGRPRCQLAAAVAGGGARPAAGGPLRQPRQARARRGAGLGR
jgi:hypothetical protein